MIDNILSNAKKDGKSQVTLQITQNARKALRQNNQLSMKARPGYSAQKLSYQGNELAKGQKYASVINRDSQGQMRTSSGVVMHRGKNSSEIVDIKQNNFYVPMQSDRGGAL